MHITSVNDFVAEDLTRSIGCRRKKAAIASVLAMFLAGYVLSRTFLLVEMFRALL